jgi:hypothetical protein
MIPHAVDPDHITDGNAVGRILCHDVVAAGESGRQKLAKGHIVESDDLPALRAYSGEIHLIELEPDDVHEDEASIRLARSVSGDGIDVRPPVESQSHLRAAHRGVVSVCVGALEAMNSLPDVSVFTVYDGQPVDAGKAVGAAKVTPLAISGEILRRAEEIARSARPVIQVRPFLGEKVGVVVRDRVTGKAKERFESAIAMKIGWFGSTVAGIRYLPESVEEVTAAIEDLLADGVALILAAGVNSTDPLDLTLQALDRAGAVTERRGVPAHPGSTCWLAYVGDVPIFGLALCGMFSQTTVLDLLLPRFLSGQKVCAPDIAAFGHGGMLSKDMAFRFPSYS